MGKRHYSEQQIIAILNEAELASSASEVIRKHGINRKTFYRWKARYVRVQPSPSELVRVLTRENALLKRIVANQALENETLRELHSGRRGHPRQGKGGRPTPRVRAR